MDTPQERAKTDAGLTGDKIRVADPAAAPLDTDAEAGGVPTSGPAALASLRRLVEIARATPRPDTFGAWRQPHEGHRRLGWTLLAWGGVLVGLGVWAGLAGLG